MLDERMDLLSGLRLLREGVERLENYVHVELSEVTCHQQITSDTPASAKAHAMPGLTPEPPPVIKTDFPENSFKISRERRE
jgi:hypothetical protein